MIWDILACIGIMALAGLASLTAWILHGLRKLAVKMDLTIGY